MGYALAADGVMLIHFGFIAFALLGSLLLLKWPRLIWVHLPALAWGIYIETTGTDDVRFCWEVTAASTRCATSTTATFIPDTWYFIEGVYDTAAPSVELKADGVSLATNTGTLTAQTCSGACALLHIGTVSGSASDYLDQLIISTDSTLDIYATYNSTLAYP